MDGTVPISMKLQGIPTFDLATMAWNRAEPSTEPSHFGGSLRRKHRFIPSGLLLFKILKNKEGRAKKVQDRATLRCAPRQDPTTLAAFSRILGGRVVFRT